MANARPAGLQALNRMAVHVSDHRELAWRDWGALAFTTLAGLAAVWLAPRGVWPWVKQLEVGVYLAVGGTLLFGAGIALSVYRDKLLQLPEKMAKREGLFRVLDWR